MIIEMQHARLVFAMKVVFICFQGLRMASNAEQKSEVRKVLKEEMQKALDLCD